MFANIKSQIHKLAENVNKTEISRLEAMMEEMKSAEDLDELIVKHSVSQREAARICGMSEASFRIKAQQARDEGVIDDVKIHANRYLYTLEHIRRLMEWMEKPSWRDKFAECVVMAIYSNKGGTGKSTTATSIAAGFALDTTERPNVLVIDLDPQGSQRIFSSTPDDTRMNSLSAVDIMLGASGEEDDGAYAEYIEAGYSHEEILQESIYGTHIAGFDVIPAFPDDERFTAKFWINFAKGGKLDFVEYLNKHVVGPLKKYYDIIIIDTAPNISPLTWTAVESANAMITPVTPRMMDWSSTCQFLNTLSGQFDDLPSKGENLKFYRLVVVNYDDEKNRDRDLLNRIKDSAGPSLANNIIKRSHAFESAARKYCTIYDLKSKDAPARQLEKARDSVDSLVRELRLEFADIDWGGSNE